MWISLTLGGGEGASIYLVDGCQGDCRETNPEASEESHGAQCYSSNVGATGPQAESNHCALLSYDDKNQRGIKFHMFLKHRMRSANFDQ